LNGKELILATKPYAKEIRGKSWYYALSTLTLLLCAFAGALFAPYFILKLICGISSGLMSIRMFIIYHDYLHHSILQKSKFAQSIMTVFGLYMLTPVSIWKRSHDHHHNHNSKLFSASIGSYPIASKAKFLSMTPGERRTYLFVRHPLTILFAYLFMFIIGMCVNSFLSAPKKHADSLLAVILHLTASVLIFWFLGWQAWMCAMLIPFFMSCSFGAYLFYAQHNFPTVTFKSNSDWKYEIAALESSSFMRMNKFMRWITANIGYHHIHHLNSRIPFYRLPETLAAIPQLQQYKTTSLSPRDIRACMKLKVWDPERNKMITLRQLQSA